MRAIHFFVALVLVNFIEVTHAQSSFYVKGDQTIINLKPVNAFQLKDSTYMIVCTSKPHGAALNGIEVVTLNKEGKQTSSKPINIALCTDNFPIAALQSYENDIFILARSGYCDSMLPTNYMLKLGDTTQFNWSWSTKYMSHNSEFPKFFTHNWTRQIHIAISNKVVIYNDTLKQINETDSIGFKLNGPIASYPDSGLVVLGQHGNFVNMIKFSKTGNVVQMDSVPFGVVSDSTIKKIDLVNFLTVSLNGDVLLGYKKEDVASGLFKSYLRMLNRDLLLKWEVSINNLQKPTSPKSLLVENKEHGYVYTQQLNNASGEDINTTVMFHIDSLGNIYRTDTLVCSICKWCQPSLVSLNKTFDGGLLISYICKFINPGFPSDYTYLLVKTDSNYRVGLTSGVGTPQGYPLFTIYPNPAHAHLTIETVANFQSILLYDMLGQQISVTTTPHGSGYEIDLPVLAKGVYFLKLLDEEGSLTTKKVMIE
ncbi:MAG: T9SS type A sorting domain-containing protein [Bacteroidia bacterium]|nr:T9SS type A sorting domain-containing protein [Bacteroidia bacterium]